MATTPTYTGRAQKADVCLNQLAFGGGISATASGNVSQVGGNAVAVDAGNSSTGTQRVVLASNQPNIPISGQFVIPKFDYQAYTYVGSTNNVATHVFKSGGSGGTTVATLTYAYVAAGVADNDKITSITQS